jgi:hypothetical protein
LHVMVRTLQPVSRYDSFTDELGRYLGLPIVTSGR